MKSDFSDKAINFTLELVVILIRSKDANISCLFNSLESLGLMLWGKHELGGKLGIVKVVFDSLKTNNDRHGDYSADWKEAKDDLSGAKTSNNRVYFSVCFDEDGNLVDFWDINPKARHYDSDMLMSNFKSTLLWYKKGLESCSESDCQNCELYKLCHYDKPLQKKEKLEVSDVVSSVTLTDEQLSVVNYKDGICVVDAGAGSGKSQSVVLRIVSLLTDGVKPQDIMLLSFSNSAVKVLLDRVSKMVKAMGLETNPEEIRIQTFNSIGYDIIKEKYLELGFSDIPNLIDSIEAYDLVLESIDWDNQITGLDYKNPNMRFINAEGVGKTLFRCFQYIRDNGIDKETYDVEYKNIIEKNIPEAEKDILWETYLRYVDLLKENNYIDYSDQSKPW